MDCPSPTLPSLQQMHAAAQALGPYAERTPLLRLNTPNGASEIYLKLENLQPIGAYKIRSMGNILLTAQRQALDKGVYTASSGNAGLGMAWMAQQLGIAARVYAPETSPAAKLNAIREFGADVHLLDSDAWWQIIENGGHPDDPGLYADAVRSPAALAGNATIGLEIIEQLPDVDTIFVPFGGGGVACGIAAAARACKPATRIIVAESDAAAPATAALRAGRPEPVAMQPSFISGAGAPCVLREMWPLVSTLIDGTAVVAVSDVAAAIRLLCIRNHVVAEGAGAIAVAAALAAQGNTGKTVCVVTGGNIDPEIMAKILLRQPV
jgi:threonine dehydratase